MTKWKQLGSINLLEIEKNNPINLDAQLHYGELEIKNATYKLSCNEFIIHPQVPYPEYLGSGYLGALVQ